MVDLEGAGRKRPPPAAQDTFERLHITAGRVKQRTC